MITHCRTQCGIYFAFNGIIVLLNPILVTGLASDFAGATIAAYYLGFRFRQLDIEIAELLESKAINHDKLLDKVTTYYKICSEVRRQNVRWKWSMFNTYFYMTPIVCFDAFMVFGVVKMYLIPWLLMVAIFLVHLTAVCICFVPPAMLAGMAKRSKNKIYTLTVMIARDSGMRTKLKVTS